MLRIFWTIFLIGFIPLGAADAQNLSRDLQNLTAVNRINPLQNPEYALSEDVLERRILDRKSKVIGEVNDITVKKNGAIQDLVVDFDRLRLGSDVFLNYRQNSVGTTDDAFTLAMDADEFEEFFPTMLANMATASGEEVEIFSTRRLSGIDVRRVSGRKIGEVQDILFNASGTRVQALFVEISSGTIRGESIAIPFRSAEFKEQSGRLYAEISDGLADAALTIADD